jgi:hypothetical protein
MHETIWNSFPRKSLHCEFTYTQIAIIISLILILQDSFLQVSNRQEIRHFAADATCG